MYINSLLILQSDKKKKKSYRLMVDQKKKKTSLYGKHLGMTQIKTAHLEDETRKTKFHSLFFAVVSSPYNPLFPSYTCGDSCILRFHSVFSIARVEIITLLLPLLLIRRRKDRSFSHIYLLDDQFLDGSILGF